MTLKKNTTTTTSGKVQQSHGCLKWMKAVAYHQMPNDKEWGAGRKHKNWATKYFKLTTMLLKNNNKEF